MDIQNLLKELNRTMHQADIAKAVGSSQPTIHRLMHGKSQPRYALGKALEAYALSKGISAANPTKPNAENP